MPGDEISTSHYLPDWDTWEYWVPSIHVVEFIPSTPIDEEENKGPEAPGI